MRRLAPTVAFVALVQWSLAAQGGNAVREGSSVGGPFCFVVSGSPDVTVAGRPIAREGDPIRCVEGVTCDDNVTPITGTIGNGSSSVFVNGVPVAVRGLSTVEGSCVSLSGFGFWPFVEIGE